MSFSRFKAPNKEVDLREEFDNLLFGKDGGVPHNHLVLIRAAKRDASGNLIKCACVSDLTDEADTEVECPYCLGEKYLWAERFSRCYSSMLGADGGKANRTKRIIPGEIRTDYKLFYFRYDEKISYKDKIIELRLDIEGIAQVPYKREIIYRPETIQLYRADQGRVEYMAIYCREESSIRENL
jgi:hypothetical protein